MDRFLTLRSIDKHFPGVHALKSVDFELNYKYDQSDKCQVDLMVNLMVNLMVDLMVKLEVDLMVKLEVELMVDLMVDLLVKSNLQ